MTLEEMLDTMFIHGAVSLDVWDADDKYVETVGPRYEDNDVSAVDEFVPYYDCKVAGFHSDTTKDGESQTVIDVKPNDDAGTRTVPVPDEDGLAKVADLLAKNVRWNLESHFRDDSWAAFLRVETAQTVLSDLGIDCQLRCNHAYVNGVESTETF